MSRQRKSPGRQARAESRKTFDVQQQYSGLSHHVNLNSCWWCDYFAAVIDDRRRQRMFCALDGERVRPESLCHLDAEVRP